MALKWTGKALSDLVRLYEFLAIVNESAAARAVQALTIWSKTDLPAIGRVPIP